MDALIVLLHLMFASSSVLFHVDFENNIPTIYQSLKLLFFGGLFLVLGWSKKLPKHIKFFIIPLGIVMLFLGLDELVQLHENSYRLFQHVIWLNPDDLVRTSAQYGYHSSLWLLYYLPIIALFLIWCGYWLRYFKSKHQDNFWIVLVSAILLGIIFVAEILGSTGDYSQTTYFWLVTIEEASEMMLASVLVFGGLKVLNHYGLR